MTSYPQTNAFTLTFVRSMQNSLGEDWDASSNAYSMLEVCFFTGDGGWSQTQWKGTKEACYNYELNNLVSTYRGQYLTKIKIGGLDTAVYGGVEGPVLTGNLFFYHSAPLGSYSTAVCAVIKLGYVS
jgi:hypothetical protein